MATLDEGVPLLHLLPGVVDHGDLVLDAGGDDLHVGPAPKPHELDTLWVADPDPPAAEAGLHHDPVDHHGVVRGDEGLADEVEPVGRINGDASDRHGSDRPHIHDVATPRLGWVRSGRSLLVDLTLSLKAEYLVGSGELNRPLWAAVHAVETSTTSRIEAR